MDRADDLIDRPRRFRHEHGVSQEHVGRQLGVSAVTVNRWEQRKSVPSRANRHALDRLLRGVPGSSTLGAAGAQLPADLTPFVGRAAELAELRELWPRCRLLTLTGLGGIGKSRLALQLLRTGADLVLGLVDMDPVWDPALVLK